MKSIYHGTAGANAKLRGKKTCVLSCQCCVLMNIKDAERIKEANKEIKQYNMPQYIEYTEYYTED